MIIAKTDLCVGMLQPDRMRNGDAYLEQLEVIDTEIRENVRSRISAELKAESQEIFVTGPGGTGKSFNLARFVMEQRFAGHVVVYVPTMDNVIRDPTNLLDELAHAVKMAPLTGFTASSIATRVPIHSAVDPAAVFSIINEF